MSELKAISGNEIREDIDYNTRGVDPEDKEWRKYGKELCDTLYYRKSEADNVIAEKDKGIAKLKSDIADLRDDKKLTDTILVERNKEIAELKADYDEVRGRLQTANLIKDEQKAKTDKLLSCLKYLVMGDLIKDCPPKKVATEIVKEYDNGLG